MKQTAVVVAPGRGTYNKPELGYLKTHHADQTALIQRFNAYRAEQDQPTVTELDGAAQFSAARHTRGDNASPLIYACAYADFLSIDQDKIDVLAVTGNSMGWYIALACAGALSADGGMAVVNTMGTLMQDHLIGGQLIYPFADENWVPIAGRKEALLTKIADIDSRDGHELALSIDLGGMLVIAGTEPGLTAFEAAVPRVQDMFPMRLPNHAAFHTPLQAPVAAKGRAQLPAEFFQDPNVPMVDGRGAIWHPKSTDADALRTYTLDHQVVAPYDFTAAIRVAAREFMPDMFIVLGPGTTLGGATAQSLISAGAYGLHDKASFQAMQATEPKVISMGIDAQRNLVTKR